ncbi:U3 small nucleolar RNA-associated protein 15 [Lecanora helva]
MSAPVVPLQPVKLAPGPSPLTPEQTYWRTFKSQLLIPSSSKNPINHISAPLPPLNALAQTSDHFAVSTGTRVQIFSIRSRKLVKTISRFDDVAHSAEIRRDGRVLVAGDESGGIQVFDINSRAILKTWKEHKQPVWTTKFSPTEPTTLMSASDDRTVRLWDLPSQESTATFTGHQDYVRCGAFMPGQASGLLVSGAYDQTVKLWDSRAPANAAMTFKHAAPVEDVLPMPSGTTVLAAADNQISVLDLVAARPLQILKNHQKTVTSLCLASNDTRLVGGGLDGHVKMFETTAWNVVAGSKYPLPILSLCVVTSGPSREDRHLAVGMQSGDLSIKTRLSGQQKVRERERQKEMQALIEGKADELDKKKAKKPKGLQKRFRGQDFTGEGADIIIEGREKRHHKKPKFWETLLRKGKYAAALDEVLAPEKGQQNLPDVVTLLTALRHRSATRTALSGRDDVSLQPIFKWVCKYITNPRYVDLCVDVGLLIVDLYAVHVGESPEIDELVLRLHRTVRVEVEHAQQAWQTQGMLDMIINAGG